MNELINDEAVYRTAPATPGLLKSKKDSYCYLRNTGGQSEIKTCHH